MLAWIITLFVTAILAFVLGTYCQYRWLRRPLEELRWYRQNHRFMSIGCNGRSFDLESLDGGLHWYVVERNKDGGAAPLPVGVREFFLRRKTLLGERQRQGAQRSPKSSLSILRHLDSL